MNKFFHKKFEEEFLYSERLRTTILVCFFFIATLGAGVILIFFSNNSSGDELQHSSIQKIFFFQVSVLLFEILSLLYIIRRIRKNILNIPPAAQFLNVAIEISAPAVIMYLLSQQYALPINVLYSPIINVYFVFIILSTLRLDFRLSLFAGVLAASGFLLVSIFLIRKSAAVGNSNLFSNEFVLVVPKTVALLLSGVGAAFVARQIRRSINRSLKVAEDASKVVNIFGQQLSPQVAEAMIENNGNIQSKRMNVAVLFIDIRNFTRFTIGKTPEEIVQYQNAFFTIVINTITKYGGVVNQILGDGCMVTFGAPLPADNPSQPAVEAATTLLKNLEDANAKGLLPPTRIGIGIHTGDVITGNIGNEERQQYSITGSVVILASRIEQLNKEFNSQLLVSGDVIKSVYQSVTAELIGNVNVKGWLQPLTIYKLA